MFFNFVFVCLFVCFAGMAPKQNARHTAFYHTFLVNLSFKALYIACQHSPFHTHSYNYSRDSNTKANLLIRNRNTHLYVDGAAIGNNWSSVFYPRTLRHADWRSQGSDLQSILLPKPQPPKNKFPEIFILPHLTIWCYKITETVINL